MGSFDWNTDPFHKQILVIGYVKEGIVYIWIPKPNAALEHLIGNRIIVASQNLAVGKKKILDLFLLVFKLLSSKKSSMANHIYFRNHQFLVQVS